MPSSDKGVGIAPVSQYCRRAQHGMMYSGSVVVFNHFP
jgi:hypothetical protein